MKLGVIGSGTVGRVLASAFLTEGYEVMLSSRNSDLAPQLLADWPAIPCMQGAARGCSRQPLQIS